jgi:hypothetical protein
VYAIPTGSGWRTKSIEPVLSCQFSVKPQNLTVGYQLSVGPGVARFPAKAGSLPERCRPSG